MVFYWTGLQGHGMGMTETVYKNLPLLYKHINISESHFPTDNKERQRNADSQKGFFHGSPKDSHTSLSYSSFMMSFTSLPELLYNLRAVARMAGVCFGFDRHPVKLHWSNSCNQECFVITRYSRWSKEMISWKAYGE